MIRNQSEKGQIAIMFGLMLVGILAFVALALDGGMIFMARRNAQDAADSASFAGALAEIQAKDWHTAALARAALNGFDNNGHTNTVSVNYPPASGNHMNDEDYFQVIIHNHINTNFLHLISAQAMENTSESVVKISQSEGRLVGGDAIFVATSPTDCQSFYADGGAAVTLNGGGIFVNSNCSVITKGKLTNAALYETGNPSIVVNNGSISVVGAFMKPQYSGILSPTPITGVPAQSYPDLDMPNCSLRSNFSSDPNYVINQSGVFGNTGQATAKPGVYPNGFTVSNGVQVTMQSGLYCIDGNFTINGGTTLVGNNVLIVMRGGAYSIGNGANVTLTAYLTPNLLKSSTGVMVDFKGLLIIGNPSFYPTLKTYTYDGGGTTKYIGTVYVPKSDCVFSDGATSNLFDVQMICLHIKTVGGMNLVFNFHPEHYYISGGSTESTVGLDQ